MEKVVVRLDNGAAKAVKTLSERSLEIFGRHLSINEMVRNLHVKTAGLTASSALPKEPVDLLDD